MQKAVNQRPYLFAVGVLLVGFIFQAICTGSPLGLYDEGVVLFGASRVMDGDIIHRDFYSNYGPGQFYALAALFKVFGPSILVERVWDVFLRSISVALIFLIVERSTRSILRSFGTAAVCLAWFASFGFYGYPAFPAFTAALAGVMFLVFAFETPDPRWPLPAAGICAGISFLFRYDIGIATAAAMATVAGFYAAAQPPASSQAITRAARCVASFCAGFALIALPVLGAFVAKGMIGDLVFDIITYPSEYYHKTRSLPFPNFWQVKRKPLDGVVYLPPALILLISGIIASRYRDRGLDDGHSGVAKPWVEVVLIALSCVYFAKGLVRTSSIHMSLAIITTITLTAIGSTHIMRQGLIRRVMPVTALILVAVFTVLAIKDNAAAVKRDFGVMLADVVQSDAVSPPPWLPAACRGLTGLETKTCFSLDSDHLRTLEFLKARTRPGDFIYIGLGRHDKIVINDVALYFLADLRSPTKWHHFDPGLQTSAAIQQEMIGELRRNPPHYVVLESQWDQVIEPNASAQSSGVVMLDEYIRRNFRPVATFGAISVLER